MIARQAYIKVIREVSRIGQQDIEEQRMLTLYEDKVTTKHRQFPIEHVIDISHRKVGVVGGLLYLHTKSGVFSYTVKTSTDDFIMAFKRLKQNT